MLARVHRMQHYVSVKMRHCPTKKFYEVERRITYRSPPSSSHG